jgi:hypothetical protein
MLVKISGKVHKVMLENCLLEPYEVAKLLNESEDMRLSEITWNLEENTAISLSEFIHGYFKRNKDV